MTTTTHHRPIAPRLALGLLLACYAALAACGSDDDHEEVDDEACEHLEDGPPAPVTAAISGDGPPISDDHKRYDITLADVTGGKGGRVSFAVDAAHVFIFFLSANVPVTFTDAGGVAVTPEAIATSSSACTAIKAKITVPLKVGTYTLTLGPTAATSVSVVVEEEAHEH